MSFFRFGQINDFYMYAGTEIISNHQEKSDIHEFFKYR